MTQYHSVRVEGQEAQEQQDLVVRTLIVIMQQEVELKLEIGTLGMMKMTRPFGKGRS